MEKLLVVIDVQKDFIDGALRNEEAIKKMPNIIQRVIEAKDEKIPIWATRDTHHENYLETNEGKNLPVPHCLMGTEGWEIDERIKPFIDETFDKPTFGSVNLAKEICNYSDLKEVEVVGFCTDICVISNILMMKAYRPELNITVYEDSCAGVTPESHAAALIAMKSCQIIVK